jgi:PAS domain S-box-containing protein
MTSPSPKSWPATTSDPAASAQDISRHILTQVISAQRSDFDAVAQGALRQIAAAMGAEEARLYIRRGAAWQDIIDFQTLDGTPRDSERRIPVQAEGVDGQLALTGGQNEAPAHGPEAFDLALTAILARAAQNTHPETYISESAFGAADAAMVGTWEWDVTSGRVMVNAHCAALIGYDPDEVTDQTADFWREAVHPEDVSVIDTRLLPPDDGGAASFHEAEYRMRHRDGHWVQILGRARVLARDADGRPTLLAGIKLDISERGIREAALLKAKTELEEALAERRTARQSFADLASASDAWLWEQDCNLRFTRYSRGENPTEHEVPGRGVLGKTHDEWLIENPGLREGADWNIVLDAQRDRVPFTNFVFPMRSAKTATERWYRISGAPVSDSEGRFRGYRGVGADVTELYIAKAKAENANKAKSSFLANMSHEIRTPLNGVLGMAEILEGRLQDPDHRKMIGVIRRSGKELLSILNDILDMSKIEAGKLELETMPFDPAEIAQRVHDLHSNIATAKQIDFEVLLGPGARDLRQGDPLRVQQVLHNLTSNAIKFTETGEVEIRVSARADKPLRIEVRDTGIGMTEDQVNRLYDEFTQADSTVTRRYGGTGLGMSITRRLVDMMGGTLVVQSEPGVGTTVRVELPLPATTRLPASYQGMPRNRMADLAGRKLLIADDNPTNCLVIRTILESCGAEVTIVSDGLSAVNLWRPGAFDAVLLDIAMPVMDGLAALSEIRRLEREHGVKPAPIIAATANVMPHQVADYIAAGFDSCVPKPISASELSQAILTLL